MTKTIRADEVPDGTTCILISKKTEEGKYKYYVMAKAIPYGKEGKIFAKVVGPNGEPILLDSASPDAVRSVIRGCARIVGPLRRKGVRKNKLGNDELAIISPRLAQRAKQRAREHGKKGKIGFMPGRVVGKLVV